MKEPTLDIEKSPRSHFNVQFGILYCVGIILIVAAHASGGGLDLANNWLPWGSYHLAIFAFCSGYFFINNKYRSPKQILWGKIKKFIIPLIFWNIFYGLLVLILKKLNIIQYGGDFTLENLFLMPFYNGHQFYFNLASWFIVPLFIIEILNIIPFKILIKKTKLYIPYFITCLIIGFLGVQFAIDGNTKDWLLLIPRVALFLPFFAFGILYRAKLERKDTSSNPVYFGILFLATIITLFLNYGPVKYNAAWGTHFDNFLLPFVGGALGITFWLRVSKILAEPLKNSRLVKTISSNTFAIMMHHILGFFILNLIYLLIARTTCLIEFNQEAFSKNVWYMVLPRHLEQFKIFYVIFGIAFSILFQKLVTAVFQKVKPKKHET